MGYRIFTDSGADIKNEILAQWGVTNIDLYFRFTDDERVYGGGDMGISDFYSAMRSGRVAKTSAANTEMFKQAFEPCLECGEDVLYLAFSSGLSSTFAASRLAVADLAAKYPDRKILTVDTLAASAGQGLTVYLAAEKMRSGADIEEVAAYVEHIRLNVAHWFTVEDLVYLKRGGRVSAAAAFFGNMLGIKPVLHVDNEGHLVPVEKVRGRRTSLNAILDHYGKSAKDPASGPVFISNAECMADVEYVASELKRRFGADVTHVTDIGPVIGAHSGPGTFAFFFLAEER